LRPFDSTWPLRPAPVAVPVTVYCNCVRTLHCVPKGILVYAL
jgi:hypothetical protein